MNNGNTNLDGQDTGVPDEHYNLVSVLYHALEGTETYGIYIEDAEDAGDEELAQFLREIQDQYRQNAQRAMQLLQQRIAQP